jgi:HEAT repeat protein
VSRYILLLSLTASLALAALALAGLALVSQPRHENGIALRRMEDRLERLEERLDDALDDLERLAAQPRPTRSPPPPAEPPASSEAAVSLLPFERPEPLLDELLARLEDLETRLKGLEVDPTERAYSFLRSRSPELRREGIRSLVRVARSDAEARQALRQMLADADPGVRRAALDGLAGAGDREAAAEIQRLLADPDAGVRREAIDSLADLGVKESGLAIAALLKDPDRRVRAEAASALGRLKASEAAGFLLAVLQDPDDSVRGEAIASLGEVGDRNAASYLRAVYDGDPGRHRTRLVRALQRLGDSQPFDAEVSRLSEAALGGATEAARSDAIRALAALSRERSRPIIEQALRDSSPRVRAAAQRARGGSN